MTDDTATSDAPGTADEKLLSLAKERWKHCEETEQVNDEAALDDLQNLAGEQWPDTIKREREKKGRPCLTINALPQFVKQVTGDIRQNKPAIKVLPADGKADKATAETFTGLIRHIEQASFASRAYVHAADGAASCGKGWFRVVTEYSDNDGFNQDIRIKRGKNHFAARFDPAAQELDYSDGKFAFISDLMELEEFKAAYPKASTTDFEDNKSSETRDTDWWDGKYVRIAEYWVKKPVTKEIALLEDGSVIDTSELDGAALSQMQIKRRRMVQTHKVCSYIVNGSEVLEGPMEWAGQYIPIVPVLGEEIVIGDRTVRHGLIRFAKDPQRMANYMASASAESIALQPKAPWVVTKEEIKGFEGMWNNAHLDNKPYLLFNPDKAAQGRPTRTDPPASPTALWSETDRAFDAMHRTTGIYPPSLGAKSNETSGKAIMARDRQSDTGTFVYVDNVAVALNYLAKILVDLIPRIYDTERMVRILGEDGADSFVPINKKIMSEGKEKIINDLAAGEYDVVVTTGPSYATKRTEAAESMTAFMQAVPAAAPIIGDLFAKAQDWPYAEQIAERLKKTLPPNLAEPETDEQGNPIVPEPPPPDPIQLMAAAGDKAMAEAKVISGAAAKAKAELEMAQVNAMTGMSGQADPGQLAAQIIEQMRAEIAQLVQGDNQDTRAQVKAMTVALEAMLAYANAPKMIQRDAAGRPVAVQAMMNGGGDIGTGVAQLGMPKQIAMGPNGVQGVH